MNYLLEAGLSKKDVRSMIFRFSPLLGYSIELVMKPKLEFLLRIMKRPLKAVVEYPRYFSYSLEGRIKPRFWVLQSRNIDCSLTDMLAKNDELFAEEYLGVEGLLQKPLQSSKVS
jgi:mTERF domain-containing protein